MIGLIKSHMGVTSMNIRYFLSFLPGKTKVILRKANGTTQYYYGPISGIDWGKLDGIQNKNVVGSFWCNSLTGDTQTIEGSDSIDIVLGE